MSSWENNSAENKRMLRDCWGGEMKCLAIFLLLFSLTLYSMLIYLFNSRLKPKIESKLFIFTLRDSEIYFRGSKIYQ